ncbi:MAG: 3-phosphoshikimate 1-carboxyvinyltransferase, partial [Alistipes sp.]|nr:3-phosphoshikimate 1-carboxyvinyltransferase [Alistipes sp.]
MDITLPPGRVTGALTPPCSKSYAQRALAAALLSEERSVLHGVEFCDDTRSALRCIELLGAEVEYLDEHTLAVRGGLKPRGHVLDAGESGLAARLFAPIAALWHEPLRVEGEKSLLQRPMSPMIAPLRALGAQASDSDGFLPLEICGPLQGGCATIDGSVSSQFVTGLLLALPLAAGDTTLRVADAVSVPYLDMTVRTAEVFGVEICHNDFAEFYIPGGQRYRGADFAIEGDWSAAAMLLVAGAVVGEVSVRNVSVLSRQADTVVCDALVRAGAALVDEPHSVSAARRPLRGFEFDATQCPDLFPALAVLAAVAEGTSHIRGVSRLRHKECDRAEAIREEFGKMGVEVDYGDDDTLRIRGGEVHAATGESRGDHRIAMALAVLALCADGPVTIRGAEC